MVQLVALPPSGQKNQLEYFLSLTADQIAVCSTKRVVRGATNNEHQTLHITKVRLSKFCEVSHNCVGPYPANAACYGENHPLPIQDCIRNSAFLQQLVTVMNLTGKLCMWTSQDCSYPEAAITPAPSSLDFCLAAPFRCVLSVSAFGGSRRCPPSARSSLFWCCQLVIYCLNEVHAQTHKHHFQEGLCE